MSDSSLPKIAIRHAISGVLAEFGIDNLELEMRLSTSVYGFFVRLQNGEDPLLVQADMMDAYFASHAEEKFREELIIRIGKALGLNITNEDKWDKTLKFLIRKEKEKSQTVEGFANWLEEYKFGPPAWKIAERPERIIENWPQAYPEAVQKEFFKSESGGYDF